MIPYALAVLALAAPETVAATVEAGPAIGEQVSLSYRVSSELADRCPERESLVRGVGARLGRDPFHAHARRQIQVDIRAGGGGLVATIAVREAGEVTGTRTLTAATDGCTELAEAVEFAIAVAVDPMAGMVAAGPANSPAVERDRAAAEPPGTGSDPRAPRVTAPGYAPPSLYQRRDLYARTAPPGTRLRWRTGITASGGSAPAASVGFLGHVGAIRDGWSGGIEARLDLPAQRSLGQGAIRSRLLAASLVGCADQSSWMLCAVATVGALHSEGVALADARSTTSPLVAAGGRTGLRFGLARGLDLVAHFDLVVPLVTTTLTSGGREVWSTSPVAALGGVGVGGVL